jgi:hypothetical protein
MWNRIAITLMFAAFATPALAQCDPNDPVTGLPDLSYSVVVWNAAAGGPATLLVVPDGSGASFTQARRPDGTPVDATIALTLADPCGPVPNFSRNDIWLESTGGNFVPCIGGTIADTGTDASGLTRWVLPLHAGGNSLGPCVVVINGTPLYTMTTLDLHFNSPDLNGDRVVSPHLIHRVMPALLSRADVALSDAFARTARSATPFSRLFWPLAASVIPTTR